MKRYRSPKAKKGELKAQWGTLRHEDPDLCFAWGDGTSQADGRLLNNALTSKRYSPLSKTWENSFLEELDKRGYDITTLKFSIQKKSPEPKSDPEPGLHTLQETQALWNERNKR